MQKVNSAISDLRQLAIENPNDIAIGSGIARGGLPLISSLGGTILLFPTGEILQLGLDDEGPIVPVDASYETISLVAGFRAVSLAGKAFTTSKRDCG